MEGCALHACGNVGRLEVGGVEEEGNWSAELALPIVISLYSG